MSARYVWDKYNSAEEKALVDYPGTEQINDYVNTLEPITPGTTVYINISETYTTAPNESEPEYLDLTLTGNIRKFSYQISTDVVEIPVKAGERFIASTRDFTTHRSNRAGVYLGHVYKDTNIRLYMQSNPSSPIIRIGTIGDDGGFSQTGKDWVKKDFVSLITAASRSKYPDDGYTGYYWYVYKGTDYIDPTAVGYSTQTPEGGKEITIQVTPRRNTYGGTVNYTYYVQLNGSGTWVSLGTTTDTSKKYTIPAETTTFQARVIANDGWGFTSTTYVTGEELIVINNEPPTAPGSISLSGILAGQPVTITLTEATDPDGTVASYTYQRSIDGGSWITIHTGNVLSYEDTVGEDWATVAYRVCATDDDGASGPYVTSETATVNSGWLFISGPAAEMGQKVAPFTLSISCGVSGETGITGISLEITLDGRMVFSGQVDDSAPAEVLIDTRLIAKGSHTIMATASKVEYLPASATYTFIAPTFSLPDGGKGVILQNNQGQPEWPMTIAALVQCDGGTLADRLAAIGSAAQIETGQYIGTGKSGSANKNQLTFQFRPKAVFITCVASSGETRDFSGPMVYGAQYANTFCGSTAASYGYGINVEWAENTLKWYHNNMSRAQLNTSGQNYYYVAIG